MIGLVRFLLSLAGGAAQAEVAARGRERGIATSIDYFAPWGAWPPSAHERRSLVLCPDLSLVSIGPEHPHDHPSRNACTLASGWEGQENNFTQVLARWRLHCECGDKAAKAGKHTVRITGGRPLMTDE